MTRFDFFKQLLRKLFLLLLLLCYETGVSTSFLMEMDIILDEGLLLKTMRSTSAGAKIWDWRHTVLSCEQSIRGCGFHFYSNGKSLASILLTLGNPEEIPHHPTRAMNPNGCLPIAVFSVPSPQTNFNLISNGLFVYFSCRHDTCQGTSAWQQQRTMTEPWEITLDPFPYVIPTPLHRKSHDFWEVSVLDQIFCMEKIGRKWFIWRVFI